MKEQKIQISKIVIEVAGHKLDLTIEQAHELQSILNKTFPDKKPTVIEKIIERDRWYPNYQHFPPVWCGGKTLDEPAPKYDKWEVTCGTNAMVVAAK